MNSLEAPFEVLTAVAIGTAVAVGTSPIFSSSIAGSAMFLSATIRACTVLGDSLAQLRRLAVEPPNAATLARRSRPHGLRFRPSTLSIR